MSHALEADPVPADSGRDAWWLRLGTERHGPTHGCVQPDCDRVQIAATDVYCRTHETFLGWGPRKPHLPHYLAIGALRFVIAAGFFFTALLDSMLPVWGIAVVSGLAIAVLPLRLFGLGRRAAALYWLVAAALGLELWFGTFTTQVDLLTWSAYAGLAAWWAFSALVANSGGGGRAGPAGTDRGAQLVAVTMTVILPALAASSLREEWRDATLILAVGGVTGALLVAAIIGVLRGGRHLDPVRPPQIPYLAKPLGLRWRVQFNRSRPGRPAGPIDRLARGVLAFIHVVLAGSALGGARLISALRLLAYGLVVVSSALANWVIRISVDASRRILGSIIAASLVCWAGLRVAWAATVRTVRVLVLPLAFAACAAVTIAWWAEAVRRYFAEGGLLTLAWIGGGVVAAAIALTLIWIALSGRPLAVSMRSAAHSANIASTKGLLILALFAVALGAPGTLFGTGPITWGWLTGGVWVLLVTATIIHLAAHRRPHGRNDITDKAVKVPKPREPVDGETASTGGTARRPENAAT